ncbi:MAG: hypothetical protein Q9167_001483 [Letrouitia subvulpina]
MAEDNNSDPLDAFGPLDVLNVLSWDHECELSVIAATLDPVSTAPSPSMGKKSSKFAQSIVPTHTLENAPPLDVLLVPGGLGTRNPDPAIVDFIRDRYPSLKYLISVCTGAGLLARAGVLDNKEATTNKKAWYDTIQLGPKVKWISHARWVAGVNGSNIWTSSGVSAGIDVILAWVQHVFGEEIAKNIAIGIEYERHMDSTNDPFADLYDLPPP